MNIIFKSFSVLLIGLTSLTSCVTSSASLCEAPNVNLRKYRHVVIDDDIKCPRELDGTILQIQKEISSSLSIVSKGAADELVKTGTPVLYHSVYISGDEATDTKKHVNFINLYFKDYITKDNKLIIRCNPTGNFFLRQLQTDLKAAFR